MTEGELKKKIVEWASELSDEVDLDYPIWFVGEEKSRTGRTILSAILEEVKKEIYAALAKREYLEGNMWNCVDEEAVKKVIKKWFGEAK
jgi:hypothetical protein